MAARLLYLTMTRMLSWLALLCRRRSTLIAETLTLRHEVTVLRRWGMSGDGKVSRSPLVYVFVLVCFRSGRSGM